jgi:F420H(2)-dependent quinone reductase
MSKDTSPIRSILPYRLGATRFGTWFIKHIISPLDRWMYHRTNGRRGFLGRKLGPVLLLTTIGRRTGLPHTIPIFYLQDKDCLIICNVTPKGEPPNPWPLNILAHPMVSIQIGAARRAYQARLANTSEIALYWPRFVTVWPAYQRHYESSGQRQIFLLSPLPSGLEESAQPYDTGVTV